MFYAVALFHTLGEQTVYFENSGAKKARGQSEALKNITSQCLSMVDSSIPTLYAPFCTEIIIFQMPLLSS